MRFRNDKQRRAVMAKLKNLDGKYKIRNDRLVPTKESINDKALFVQSSDSNLIAFNVLRHDGDILWVSPHGYPRYSIYGKVIR